MKNRVAASSGKKEGKWLIILSIYNRIIEFKRLLRTRFCIPACYMSFFRAIFSGYKGDDFFKQLHWTELAETRSNSLIFQVKNGPFHEKTTPRFWNNFYGPAGVGSSG
jgi:hypothetical protein